MRKQTDAQRDAAARVRRSQRKAVNEQAAVARHRPPKNPKRKAACRRDLLKFLTTYFPHSTGLRPFSDDHRQVISLIQGIILNGGRLTNAVYREFAKTTISENAILWAVLYGHRRFGLLTGVNLAAASGNIDSIKSELAQNDLLAEDFGEVCHYIQALDGRPQRCPSQTVNGQHTLITWRADVLVLPTIPRSAASGAIIMSKPYAKARGVKHKGADGRNVRPDLILVDDPQDDESAASPNQVQKNLGILSKNLIHSAGHGRQLAIIVNGTVIAKNDMIEALLSDTAWQGQRIKFVKSWSKAHDSFWLAEYARIRRSFDRSIVGDKARAEREATALYAAYRGEADEGCVISWEERFRKPEELSAIQHAYNVLIDDGPEVFASEYQNEPLDPRASKTKLTAALIAAKTNGLARGVVPKAAEFVTAYVDVHARLLYYAVTAWASDMSGAVLDYGTFPRQPLAYFAQATAPATMELAFPGTGDDAWIQAGLTALVNALLAGEYRREDGAAMHVGMTLIDARWGEKNSLAKSFVRRHPQFGTRLMAAQGYGSSATRQTLNSFVLKSGTREGPGWRIAPPAPGGERWVTIDTNLNKSRTAGQLILPLGTKGGIELFGLDPREHQLFADHCVSEAPVEVTGKGITLDVWEWLLPHSDNHWWDCLVGCGVAASILGCRIPGVGDRKRVPPNQRPSFATLAGGRK